MEDPGTFAFIHPRRLAFCSIGCGAPISLVGDLGLGVDRLLKDLRAR